MKKTLNLHVQVSQHSKAEIFVINNSAKYPINSKIHHGTPADLVVAKSVAIESPKQISVSKMLLYLLLDTA